MTKKAWNDVLAALGKIGGYEVHVGKPSRQMSLAKDCWTPAPSSIHANTQACAQAYTRARVETHACKQTHLCAPEESRLNARRRAHAH